MTTFCSQRDRRKKNDGKAPLAPSQTLPSNLSVAPQHEQVIGNLCQFLVESKKKYALGDNLFHFNGKRSGAAPNVGWTVNK